MLRFGSSIKIAKERFYGAKKLIQIWDVNFDNLVISKLVETKNNPTYLIGYFDEVLRQFVLILPKMSGYEKILKDNSGNKNKNTKLMFLHNDDNNAIAKVKPTGLRLKTCDALPIYDDIQRKIRLTGYGDKVYTYF